MSAPRLDESKEPSLEQKKELLSLLFPKLPLELANYINYHETVKSAGKTLVMNYSGGLHNTLYYQLLLAIAAHQPRYNIHQLRFEADIENTILGEAVVYQQRELLQIILSRPDVMEIIDLGDKHYGHTPLILAMQLGLDDIVIALISKGANVNAVDKEGNSALHYACLFRNEKMIALLLSRGARADIKNKERISPADFYLFELQPFHVLAQTEALPIRIMFELRHDTFLSDIRNRAALNPELARRLSPESTMPSPDMLQFAKELHGDYFKNRAWGMFLFEREEQKFPSLPAKFKTLYDIRLAEGTETTQDEKERAAAKSVLATLCAECQVYHLSEHLPQPAPPSNNQDDPMEVETGAGEWKPSPSYQPTHFKLPEASATGEVKKPAPAATLTQKPSK